MFRDGAGFWVCPDDAAGEDVVSLSRQNAFDARARRQPLPRELGAHSREIHSLEQTVPVVIESEFRIFDDTFDETFE